MPEALLLRGIDARASLNVLLNSNLKRTMRLGMTLSLNPVRGSAKKDDHWTVAPH